MSIALENCRAVEGQFEPFLLPPLEAPSLTELSREGISEPKPPRPRKWERLPTSIPEWTSEIKLGYLNHTSHTLEFGMTVHRAKLALKWGGWGQLFREREENGVPFGKTTGKKWDSIGEVCGAIGQRPDHLAMLPGSFEALYQLSRLGFELFRQAVEDGAVHSDLTEDGAREVLQHYKHELKRKPRSFNTTRFLAQTRDALETLLATEQCRENLGVVLAEFQEMTELIAEAVQTPAEDTGRPPRPLVAPESDESGSTPQPSANRRPSTDFRRKNHQKNI